MGAIWEGETLRSMVEAVFPRYGLVLLGYAFMAVALRLVTSGSPRPGLNMAAMRSGKVSRAGRRPVVVLRPCRPTGRPPAGRVCWMDVSAGRCPGAAVPPDGSAEFNRGRGGPPFCARRGEPLGRGRCGERVCWTVLVGVWCMFGTADLKACVYKRVCCRPVTRTAG
jgi:hypothetical protein